MQKIALAMIVKASDDEAKLLNRCLDYIAPHVDGIFITITGENEACEAVCKLHKANVSHFKWINDFAAARNFNFSQVPKDYNYIIWLDADDVVRNAEKIRPTLENHNHDTYSLNYLYAFDDFGNPVVVHLKTQIVKNDGCVEWVGKLHEDFKANRQIDGYFLKGIDRIHLSTPERFGEAKERNLEVAKGQLAEFPDDPRAYWNVANSYSALQNWEEALKNFDEFIYRSESEEEKYIARLRRSESYYALGKIEKALDETRFAIGMRPEYPDAYFHSGRLLFKQKQFLRATEMFITGLRKKPPCYSIIVYNPREYDYNPMMDLARCFLKLERPDNALTFLEASYKIVPSPSLKSTIKDTKEAVSRFKRAIKIIPKLEKITDKEKFKEAYDKLDPDIKSYPPVTVMKNKMLIKETSSGKDLVYYCGFTSRTWDGNTTDIGGSEEAVINLTKIWAEQGWNITVYNNCGHKEVTCGKVVYKPFWEFNYRDKQDIIIVWRNPIPCQFELQASKVFVDLHDVIPDGEFTPTRLEHIDKVFVKSNFHKSLFPSVPEDKFVVVPNGIWPDIFKDDVKKDDLLSINTSSPERSLSAFIDIAEMVKKEIPDAKFKWAYGWGVYDYVHKDNQAKMDWKNEMIKRCEKVGVEMLGMISHEEVAKLYKTANVFLMPSEFAEIDCISLSKAMAAKAIPITTDFAAMGEKKGIGGYFFHSDKNKDNWCTNYQIDFSVKDEETKRAMADEVINFIKNPHYEMRDKMSSKSKDKFDWINISKIWESEFA